jgi:mono/diheme cytochrome c family protein
MLGHSSSLVSRFVSSINPRAFVFTPAPADGSKPVGYAILAFTRGEQFVEVAVHDPVSDEVNLYIVFFKQDCQDAPGGCTFGDLLTPRLESGWKDVRIYESSTALNNTIADCAQCHQPDSTKPNILRMQELAPPYTHFFSPSTTGGRALLDDFHAAHGTNEGYGPIPASLIDKSDPAKLRDLLVATGFGDQPNMFDSKAIEAEVSASAPEQPLINVPAGKSAAWQALYDRAVAGQVIAAPYHDVKVTDPSKLAAMTDIYKQVAAGAAAPSKLPDIRDVFLDDGLRDMGFAPKAGLDGRGLLTQICGQCHNARLDQTVSRAKFNAEALDKMDRAERDTAIGRLLAESGSAQKMPPVLFRTITDDERQLMIDELEK